MNLTILKISFVLMICNCAILHQHHIGDIDNTSTNKEKFTILVSQTGFAVGDLSVAAYGLNRTNNLSDKDLKGLEFIRQLYELSNMGPRTGARVFSDSYMDKITEEVYKKCPSGNITGLTSTRETARYPVITGEIAKITGYCIETKK